MKWNDLTLLELSIIGEQSSEQDLKSKQFHDIHSQIKIRWTRLVSDLNFFSLFILEFSEDMPFFYGLFSIMFAIILGVGAALIRRVFSNFKKKMLLKS